MAPFLDIKNKIITGFDFRYLHTIGYSQFLTEADEPNDLTRSAPADARPELHRARASSTSFQAPGYAKDILVSSGGT